VLGRAPEVIATVSAVRDFPAGDSCALITTTEKCEDIDDGMLEGPGLSVHGFHYKCAIDRERHLVHLHRVVSRIYMSSFEH
jgi:hypothetical protein